MFTLLEYLLQKYGYKKGSLTGRKFKMSSENKEKHFLVKAEPIVQEKSEKTSLKIMRNAIANYSRTHNKRTKQLVKIKNRITTHIIQD